MRSFTEVKSTIISDEELFFSSWKKSIYFCQISKWNCCRTSLGWSCL